MASIIHMFLGQGLEKKEGTIPNNKCQNMCQRFKEASVRFNIRYQLAESPNLGPSFRRLPADGRSVCRQVRRPNRQVITVKLEGGEGRGGSGGERREEERRGGGGGKRQTQGPVRARVTRGYSHCPGIGDRELVGTGLPLLLLH